MNEPYTPPKASGHGDASDHVPAIPGRAAIWSIAGIAFCIGAASLLGAIVLWGNQSALADLSGIRYLYYLMRPLLLAIAFLGMSWRCIRYADVITHHSIHSNEVRAAHGKVWNWFAAVLIGFAVFIVFHLLGL